MEDHKVRQTLSLDRDIILRFRELAEPKGIKLSTWVNQQMIQFIEDEEYLLKRRRERLEREGDA